MLRLERARMMLGDKFSFASSLSLSEFVHSTEKSDWFLVGFSRGKICRGRLGRTLVLGRKCLLGVQDSPN